MFDIPNKDIILPFKKGGKIKKIKQKQKQRQTQTVNINLGSKVRKPVYTRRQRSTNANALQPQKPQLNQMPYFPPITTIIQNPIQNPNQPQQLPSQLPDMVAMLRLLNLNKQTQQKEPIQPTVQNSIPINDLLKQIIEMKALQKNAELPKNFKTGEEIYKNNYMQEDIRNEQIRDTPFIDPTQEDNRLPSSQPQDEYPPIQLSIPIEEKEQEQEQELPLSQVWSTPTKTNPYSSGSKDYYKWNLINRYNRPEAGLDAMTKDQMKEMIKTLDPNLKSGKKKKN